MAALIGTTANAEHAYPARIKSIMLTAAAGGVSVLSIAPYSRAAGQAILLVAALASTTTQIVFDGLPFSTGFTVIPDANTASYVVEYENIP